MPKLSYITATTGDFRGKHGTVSIHFFVINDATHAPIADNVDRVIKGATDQLVQRIAASTHGAAKSGVLGNWKTRNMGLPTGTPVFIRSTYKSEGDIFPCSVCIGLMVDADAPLIEIQYPLITDRTSTLSELSVSGRLRVMTPAEVAALDLRFENTQERNRVYEEFRGTDRGETDDEHFNMVQEHLTNVCKDARAIANGATPGWVTAFLVSVQSAAKEIKLRTLALGTPSTTPSVRKKVVRDTGDRALTITSRKRRIKL